MILQIVFWDNALLFLLSLLATLFSGLACLLIFEGHFQDGKRSNNEDDKKRHKKLAILFFYLLVADIIVGWMASLPVIIVYWLWLLVIKAKDIHSL